MHELTKKQMMQGFFTRQPEEFSIGEIDFINKKYAKAWRVAYKEAMKCISKEHSHGRS